MKITQNAAESFDLEGTQEITKSQAPPAGLNYRKQARTESSLRTDNLLCFCHLRWNFVYQRPQHLLSRFACNQNVYVFEEPQYESEVSVPGLNITAIKDQLTVLTPILPSNMDKDNQAEVQREPIAEFIDDNVRGSSMAWYYTPMALAFTSDLDFDVIVYDCMDELTHFAGAHPMLSYWERELLKRADLVFTGGETLYRAKRSAHPRIYAMPSSIDREHFAKARRNIADPADQKYIPWPRAGFFGVLDERLDIELLRNTAAASPDVNFIMIGPVVKINPNSLPKLSNIHYFGAKKYEELPAYLANWDVAILPFALNDSTKYISPTKIPEYLAGGRPVVSTPITDVVHPYGAMGLVHIAENAQGFMKSIRLALPQRHNAAWLADVDKLLSQTSWDKTWSRMDRLTTEMLNRKRLSQPEHRIN